MARFRFEIILAFVLILLHFAFSFWQSTPQLTESEVDEYISVLENTLPEEMHDRDELISRLRDWGNNDDGQPIYMLNLMRFFDTLQPFPGSLTSGTPMQANAQYEDAVLPMLIGRGSYPMVAGDVTGIRNSAGSESNLIVYDPELDNWDRVLIVRYPGRRTFLDLLSDPQYLEAMPNKMAALDVVLTPVDGELIIPDLRWVTGGGFLALFLLVGWIQSARRNKKA